MTVHAGYDPIGNRCLGHVQPGTRALSEAVLAKWGGSSDGIYNCRNVRGGTSKSAHAEGRAYDHHWTNEKSGFEIANALVALNDQLGIQVVIFWGRIWSYTKGWHAYTGDDPHHTHLHIEQNWSGATELMLPEANRVLNPQGDDDMLTEAEHNMLVDIHKVTVDNIQGVLSTFVQPMLTEIKNAVESDDHGGPGQITTADIDAIAKRVLDAQAERLKT
jgi:hypothetical protein